jgi:HAD superfamily hydrolase (TIGR01509 family)
MKTTLIIFDCDGVLVDSEIIFKTSQRISLERQNVVITEEWLHQNTHGFPLESTLIAIESFSGKRIDRKLFRTHYEHLLNCAFSGSLSPINGLFELCNTLLESHKGICLATNGDARATNIKLRSTGLDYFFKPNVRFCASQVPRPKPAPDIFELAARTLGHKADECLVIEDSPFGVRGAKAAGMYTIGFIGGSHARFSGTDNYTSVLYDAGADIVIAHHSQIIRAIP